MASSPDMSKNWQTLGKQWVLSLESLAFVQLSTSAQERSNSPAISVLSQCPSPLSRSIYLVLKSNCQSIFGAFKPFGTHQDIRTGTVESVLFLNRANTFPGEKNDGAETFQEKKSDGANISYEKKVDRARTFSEKNMHNSGKIYTKCTLVLVFGSNIKWRADIFLEKK